MRSIERAAVRNQRLNGDLATLLAWKSDYATQVPVDVVITTNEINDRHGTGVLVKRILEGRRNIFSIRFRNDWGDPQFGDWNLCLKQSGFAPWDTIRPEAFRNILRLFGGHKVRNVLCVPFLVDEPMAAIALHEVFGARLCAYVMDDQNVASNHIPDVLMREFLQRCSLRLATHPELRVAYERKYGLPFYLLPAVAPDRLIAREPIQPAIALHEKTGGKRGAMIGSFWDQSWFDRLCAALVPTGYSIDWFGNNRSPFVKFPKEQLLRARINPRGIVSEDQLAIELREYPFVIVPTGTFDPSETNTPVTLLSLPGRIPFATAVSQTPILVVGSTSTCASRFVKHFGIGQTVGYDRRELKDAMDRLRDPKAQVAMRSNAARIAPAFSDCGVVEWLQESMELGRAADNRFEDAFEGYEVVGRTPGSAADALVGF
jgi:hypothetical protein